MSKVWPHEKIRELLALAQASGKSIASLASNREAELFRFAIYGFRRKNAGFTDLSVTIDGTNVIIARREDHSVTIMQDAQ